MSKFGIDDKDEGAIVIEVAMPLQPQRSQAGKIGTVTPQFSIEEDEE